MSPVLIVAAGIVIGLFVTAVIVIGAWLALAWFESRRGESE